MGYAPPAPRSGHADCVRRVGAQKDLRQSEGVFGLRQKVISAESTRNADEQIKLVLTVAEQLPLRAICRLK